MSIAESPRPYRVHPTAIVSEDARIAEDVAIGPYVVIEGEVTIGPGCVIRPHVYLRGPIVMGARNQLYSGVVLGEPPQHLGYKGEETRVEIGDDNLFREHVTIHRGTTDRWVTRIGSHNFFMAGSHVGHDAIVGNHCMLANGSMVGGHCTLDDRCIMGGNAALHQHCRIGRLSMLAGLAGASKDVPPFMIQQFVNCITGVNLIGLRRAGFASETIMAVKQAYRILFKEGLSTDTALARIEDQFGEMPEIQELVEFIRTSTRGISPARGQARGVDT